MDKKQFIATLNIGDYNLILYKYALENGGKFKSLEDFENNLSKTFNSLNYLSHKNPPFTYDDLIHNVIDYYMTKLNVVSVWSPKNKLLMLF